MSATQLKRKGLKIGLEYEIEVRDRNGRLLSREKRASHSFTKAFLVFLRTLWNCALGTGNVTVSLTDINGTSKAVYVRDTSNRNITVMGLNAPAGNDAYGVRVGTSDAAFTKDDYELASKIPHGTASGQMLYGASTIEAVTDENETASYTRIIRTFTNNSGAVITVKEIGLAFVNGYETYVRAYVLMARDVLTDPQDVPDGATLTVRYKIRITYS